MTKYIFALLFTGALLSPEVVTGAALADSIGTVTKNGKNFTVHQVAPKETIYALARRYGVPMAQIQQANPGVNKLTVGQTLYVPARVPAVAATTAAQTPEQPTAAAPVTTPAPDAATREEPAAGNAAGNRVHQVENRQTLFAIARRYQVSTADLKKWNNLTSDDLREGQTLIVAPGNPPAAAPETAAASAPVTAAVPEVAAEAKVAAPVPSAQPAIRREAVKPTVIPARDKAAEKVERTETRYTESLSRVSETGLAEVMNQQGEDTKYVALHKTAPVGTILQVKNTLNNQSVYVRVSGKLPENVANDKVIIRISKRAHQKLAAADNRIRVEVNYMP